MFSLTNSRSREDYGMESRKKQSYLYTPASLTWA